MTCIWPGCRRSRVPTTNGVAHAHCATHERRLRREAFGPVSWFDRASIGELPALVVGGIPLPSPRGAQAPGTPARTPARRERSEALT